jgi:quinol monooxygenase YgiN
VIVVNRFRVPEADASSFRAELEQAHETLAAQTGYVTGRAGRNVDEPELWLLVTEWRGPGAYRRALSSYDVRTAAVPTLSRAIDEPSAFEPVVPGEALNLGGSRSLG